MEAPGEKLILKLWETLVEKGIGSLLKPWQKRREGLLEISLERKKLLTLAQTEKDIQLIKNGTAVFAEDAVLQINQSALWMVTQSEIKEKLSPVIASLVQDTIRKEINIAASIAWAEHQLADDASDPPQEKIETDWLYRWKEFASKTAENNIQQLWGKILAGEIKKPGTTSYRLFDLIDKVTPSEIELICKVFSFTDTQSSIVLRGRDKDTRFFIENNYDKNFFQRAAEIGIVSPSTTGVVNVCTKFQFREDKYILFPYIGADLFIKYAHNMKVTECNPTYYQLTHIGKELFSISNIPVNKEYLQSLAEDFQSIGADVVIK